VSPLAPPADLRTRVLSASLELLEQQGLAALSMREVARRAGVSHQAPYHHFSDRESILAALVAEGFDELAVRLGSALDETSTSARARYASVVAAGVAYVRFALDRTGIFRVMFRPELVDHARFPEAVAAGERAFATLERLVRLLGHPSPGAIDTTMQWSMVHGLATLLVDGKLGATLGSRAAREAHARAVMQAFAASITGESKPSSPKVSAPKKVVRKRRAV
jgi:AcrR family transcriptional regulator